MREERASDGAVRPALSEVPALIEHHVGLNVAVQQRGTRRLVAIVPAAAAYPGALTVAVRALRAMGFRIALPRAATALRRAADALVERGFAALEGETGRRRVYRISISPGHEARPQPLGEVRPSGRPFRRRNHGAEAISTAAVPSPGTRPAGG
jgi:hypothetical protein